MRRLVLSLSLTISFAAVFAQTQPRATPSPAPPTPTPAGVDSLDPADLEKAVALIQQKYVNPAAVSGAELTRATLAGLLERLDDDAEILPTRGAAATPTPPPFYREIIEGHIAYLRPGELNRGQLQELDTTLRGFAGKKVDAVVLDLRDCAEATDYATAAEFANRFVPKGDPLFDLRGPSATPGREFVSQDDPTYSGVIVVLIDHDTAGGAEALAAVLRHHKAILIGSKTAARAVEFADLPLPSGKVLRLAVAQVVLPGGEPQLKDGVSPDLAVVLPRAEKKEIFQQSLSKGMEQFVFEPDRPHLNEAALLAGTNPEIEPRARQRRAAGETPPHDSVLQRAIDVVTSIAVYEKQPAKSP